MQGTLSLLNGAFPYRLLSQAKYLLNATATLITQIVLKLQKVHAWPALTSVGNADRKLCVCEAVAMCCAELGSVVFCSSCRRSANPLLHSFQGSNPKLIKRRKQQDYKGCEVFYHIYKQMAGKHQEQTK